MLPAIKGVRDEVLKRCGNSPITLEAVAATFKNITFIDNITYIPYDVAPENPILGWFKRYSMPTGVYSEPDIFVEVAYANHLDMAWRRFVVCKELCHALEKTDGAHAVTDNAMEELVEAFSLNSAARSVDMSISALAPEIIAECGALEIFFPFREREKIAKSGNIDLESISRSFNIPRTYVELGLDEKYNSLIAPHM